MSPLSRLFPARRRWWLWVAAGLALRLLFIYFPRPVDPDTWDYLTLGHNLFHAGTYGMGSGYNVSPSLFRLPAYPLLLAACEQLFVRAWPNTWMNSVFLLQTLADMCGGLLLAAFAKRHISEQASEAALALAMLCPFTAVEVGIAMTECLSVFAVALGIYAAGRALAAEYAGRRDVWALLLAGCAGGLATMLRPDGGLLCAALGVGLFGYTLSFRTPARAWAARMRGSLGVFAIYCLAAGLPIVAWTARNWETFHVFQPLAPRFLNDPGERYNAGFYRWLRTWSVEFVTTANVYWNVGSDPIDPADLPARAFDSAAERRQTLAVIDDYNKTDNISPQLDARFAALAAERIRAHPLRYYLELPALRSADMLLRPRTLQFGLDDEWWNWSGHPWETVVDVLLGLLNLGYVGAAVWGFARGRVPWAWMLGGYLLLRLMALGTMENPEPRYTLECFPVLIVGAAAAWSGVQRRWTGTARGAV